MLIESKPQINPNTATMGDFNTPLSPMGSSSKQISNQIKTKEQPPPQQNKEISEWNGFINEKALTKIYKIFHSKITEYTFFSVSHKSVSKIDHILRHKENFNQFRETEINARILFDHNRMKLGIRKKKCCNINKLSKIKQKHYWMKNGSLKKSRRE